jgi:hypothetical protein
MVFDNLTKNYGPNHSIHYINLVIVTEENDYFMIDCPQKTFLPLGSHSSFVASTASDLVDVRIFQPNDFPLAINTAGASSASSSYSFNDIISVRFPNLSSELLQTYYNRLVTKLFSFHLLKRFGKTQELKELTSVHELTVENQKDYLSITGYNTNFTIEAFMTAYYLAGHTDYNEEFMISMIKIVLPLPRMSQTSYSWMRKDTDMNSKRNTEKQDSDDEPSADQETKAEITLPLDYFYQNGQLVSFTSAREVARKSSNKPVHPVMNRMRGKNGYIYSQESLVFQFFRLIYQEWIQSLKQQLFPGEFEGEGSASSISRILISYPNHPSSHLHHLYSDHRGLSSKEISLCMQILQNQLDFLFSKHYIFLQMFLFATELFFQHILFNSVTSSSSVLTAVSQESMKKSKYLDQMKKKSSSSSALKEFEYYLLSSFLYDCNPLLFYEIFTKLIRKLEPSLTKRLFPICNRFSLCTTSPSSRSLSLRMGWISSFESMENGFFQNTLIYYQTRFLTYFCDSIGGLESHLNILICMFYILEVFYQSIVTLSLAKGIECFEFCLRFEEILRGYCEQLRSNSTVSQKDREREEENMKEVVLSRIETLKKLSRQKKEKISSAILSVISKKMERSSEQKLEEAVKKGFKEGETSNIANNSENGGLWNGVSWFLSQIGLSSSETSEPNTPGAEANGRSGRLTSSQTRTIKLEPEEPVSSSDSATTENKFHAVDLLEEFVSPSILNKLLNQRLETTPGTGVCPSLTLFLLSGILKNWLIVRHKKYFYTVSYIATSLLSHNRFHSMLKEYLPLMLFSPTFIQGENNTMLCANPLFPSFESSKGSDRNKEDSLFAAKYEVVHTIMIVFRLQKYLKRAKTGGSVTPSSLSQREKQVWLVAFLEEQFSEQYLRKLVDLEYNNYSLYSSHSSHGGHHPSSSDFSTHSQSHSLRYRYFPQSGVTHPSEILGKSDVHPISPHLSSLPSFQNKFFPIYFDRFLLQDLDEHESRREGNDSHSFFYPASPAPQQPMENLFYEETLWKEYQQLRQRPSSSSGVSKGEGDSLTTFQLLRGLIVAYLMTGEIQIPLLLLFELRSVLCAEVKELLEMIVEKDRSDETADPARAFTTDERIAAIKRIFIEFLLV